MPIYSISLIGESPLGEGSSRPILSYFSGVVISNEPRFEEAPAAVDYTA
jgi:hypothetical protein